MIIFINNVKGEGHRRFIDVWSDGVSSFLHPYEESFKTLNVPLTDLNSFVSCEFLKALHTKVVI